MSKTVKPFSGKPLGSVFNKNPFLVFQKTFFTLYEKPFRVF
jgi:hypothetical protein